MNKQFYCIQCRKGFLSQGVAKPDCPFCNRKFSVFLREELSRSYQKTRTSILLDGKAEPEYEISENIFDLFYLPFQRFDLLGYLPENSPFFPYALIAYLGIFLSLLVYLSFGNPESLGLTALYACLVLISLPLLTFAFSYVFDWLMSRMLSCGSQFSRLAKGNFLIIGTFFSFLLLIGNMAFLFLNFYGLFLGIFFLTFLIFVNMVKFIYFISFIRALLNSSMIVTLITALIFFMGAPLWNHF